MIFDVKCSCQHCNEHIAFSPSLVGQTITCPHCQKETRLFIPPKKSNPYTEEKFQFPTMLKLAGRPEDYLDQIGDIFSLAALFVASFAGLSRLSPWCMPFPSWKRSCRHSLVLS